MEWAGEAEENMDLLPTYSSLSILSLDCDGKPVPTPEYKDLVEFATGSRLVILDPLSDLLDIAESDDRAARGAVQILRDLSLRTGAGVLGIHHQNKVGMLKGEKHHQSGRGSSRFGAGCRWAVVLQPMDPEEAEENDLKHKDWTGIFEGKASYCYEAADDRWIRRYVVDDGMGNILASAPAAGTVPQKSPPKKESRKSIADPINEIGGENGKNNEVYY
jgi:hypothetical protein